MQNQYVANVDGIQIVTGDINSWAENAALGPDREIFSELLRLTPYSGTVSRGILPSTNTALITNNGATSEILVQCFRAFIGSRTAVGTDALANYRDVRSGLSVVAGATTLTTTLTIDVPAGGMNRWDAVYATVTTDVPSNSTTRKVKDPTSRLVTEQSVTTQLITTVTVSLEKGVEDPFAVWPAVPADSGSSYNILLGYVLAYDGMTTSTTIPLANINIVAPCLALAAPSGALTIRPTSGASATTTSQQGTAASAGAGPMIPFLPSSAVGGATLFCYVDMRTGVHSHNSGDTIDSSADWRNRFTYCISSTAASGTGDFACYSPSLANTTTFVPGGIGGAGNTITNLMSQTFRPNDPVSGVAAACTVGVSNASSSPELYVDHNDGKLKVYVPGSPGNRIYFFWLTLTAPMAFY